MTQNDDRASNDDIVLVNNEINRCLEEAGKTLHNDDRPRPGSALTPHFFQAQFYLTRVQLLDRLGVRRAAAYLRTELLDVIAAQRPDGDSATLEALGFEKTMPNRFIMDQMFMGITDGARSAWDAFLDGAHDRLYRSYFVGEWPDTQ